MGKQLKLFNPCVSSAFIYWPYALHGDCLPASAHVVHPDSWVHLSNQKDSGLCEHLLRHYLHGLPVADFLLRASFQEQKSLAPTSASRAIILYSCILLQLLKNNLLSLIAQSCNWMGIINLAFQTGHQNTLSFIILTMAISCETVVIF